MAVPSAEPHVSAVMAMLRDRLPANLPAALGVGPAGDRPYAVVYPDPGDVEQARLSGDRSRISIVFTIKVVSAGPEQALWGLDRVREAMLGDPPTVAQRVIHRMTQITTTDLERDDAFQPPLYFVTGLFRLMSQPAA